MEKNSKKSADVMLYYIPQVAGDVRQQNNSCHTDVNKSFQLLTKRVQTVQIKLLKAVNL